jgi:hypothetical protein
MEKTVVELKFLVSSIFTLIQFIIPQDHSPEPFSIHDHLQNFICPDLLIAVYETSYVIWW